MSVTAKTLIESKDNEAAQTTQYTAPNATTTLIDKFVARNHGAAAVTLSINLVPSGGAAGASNLLIQRSMAVGETYIFPEIVGHVLSPGDFISTLASTAASIAIRAAGREVV